MTQITWPQGGAQLRVKWRSIIETEYLSEQFDSYNFAIKLGAILRMINVATPTRMTVSGVRSG